MKSVIFISLQIQRLTSLNLPVPPCTVVSARLYRRALTTGVFKFGNAAQFGPLSKHGLEKRIQ